MFTHGPEKESSRHADMLLLGLYVYTEKERFSNQYMQDAAVFVARVVVYNKMISRADRLIIYNNKQ